MQDTSTPADRRRGHGNTREQAEKLGDFGFEWRAMGTAGGLGDMATEAKEAIYNHTKNESNNGMEPRLQVLYLERPRRHHLPKKPAKGFRYFSSHTAHF